MHVDWINEVVYELADRYKVDCLIRDGSLLASNAAIHTSKNLEALLSVIEPEDHSTGSFIPKLLRQISGLPEAAVQLTAEMLVFQLLGEEDTGADKKIEHVEAILGQMKNPPALSDQIREALDGGGVARYSAGKNFRDVYLRFLVRVAVRLKELESDGRAQLLSDPWRFREFIVPERTSRNGMQANALLHLIFPDTFSTAVAGSHRNALFLTFADAPGLADQPDEDRKLARLQDLIDAQVGYEINFYYTPLREIWNGEPDERAEELIEWATRLYAHASFDEQEYDYKARVTDALGPLPAMLDSGDWLDGLRRALNHKDNNLTAWQLSSKFVEWCASNPDEAGAALRSLWGDGAWDEAIDGFLTTVPKEVAGGTGGGLSLASTLLLAVEPKHTPPFRWTVYTKLIEILGRQAAAATDPEDDRSHAVRVWEDWMSTIEEVQLRMLARGVALRGALDAQGLVYWIATYAPPSDWDEASVQAFERFRAGEVSTPGSPPDMKGAEPKLPAVTPVLADALYLPLLWLQDTVDLLAEKRQLIFYGPPGTGKTYIAKYLGRHITGNGEALRLVQFHPSYTYEDFFEGYRPQSDGGQLTYQLTPGPLRLMAEQARAAPATPHVLIIDEINRGNIAKIFGELYFLLEYRNEDIALQYSPTERFSLPPNVYFIGTMNTADRSIALVDSALRRRFYFQPLTPTRAPVNQVLRSWLKRRGFDSEPAELLDELNGLIDDEDFSIGPSYLMTNGAVPPRLEHVWDRGIVPLLEEHYFGTRRDVRAEFGLDALRARLEATAAANDDSVDVPEDDQSLGD